MVIEVVIDVVKNVDVVSIAIQVQDEVVAMVTIYGSAVLDDFSVNVQVLVLHVTTVTELESRIFDVIERYAIQHVIFFYVNFNFNDDVSDAVKNIIYSVKHSISVQDTVYNGNPSGGDFPVCLIKITMSKEGGFNIL